MNKMKMLYTKGFAVIKLFTAFLYVKIFGHKLIEKDIWLICEKLTEARDNGYHLFVYIREHHPEIHAYYVIEKKSVDIHKIEKYGNVVYANTIQHYIFYISSLYSICSQPSGAAPEPKYFIARFDKLKRKNQHIIFLQHGITCNGISHGFDYDKTHYSLFSCASPIEQEYIEKTYKYPKGVVQNIGLCRFDYLVDNNIQKKKQILIMPTFRKWLISRNIPDEALPKEKKVFLESDYYLQFQKLLQNPILLKALQKNDYTMVFYPHYSLQSYIHCFDNCQSEVVIIADRWHYDVQQLLIESACLVTDYSSVFFDFVYMDKPEVFFQFDEERYRSTHYKRGYFDYREHAFGPVFVDSDQVVSYLINLIDNDCKIEEKYLDRINVFFNRRDNHNCERTYKAITEIGK